MSETTDQTTANGAAPPLAQAQDKTAAPQTALATSAPDEGGAIDVFASQANFAAAQRMARALSQSSLVPSSYQGDRGLPNVLIAMELAARIGASVFSVMQNIDIIHGRPSWRSTFLIATVNACGRFTPLRFRWEGTPHTDGWGCRAVAKDKADGEECVGPLVTWKMANDEGWSTKQGSKWKTLPELMFMYRAAAFWTRVFAPELALGMHTSDEATEIGGALGEVPLAPSATRDLEAALRGEPLRAAPGTVDVVRVEPAPAAKAEAKPKRGKGITDPQAVPVDRHPDTGEPVPPAREPGEEG